MHISIVSIFVICVIAGLCWYVNETLNAVPVLKKVVAVVIVVVAVLCLLQSMGVMGDWNSSVRVN
jgi:hypothetical protein